MLIFQGFALTNNLGLRYFLPRGLDFTICAMDRLDTLDIDQVD